MTTQIESPEAEATLSAVNLACGPFGSYDSPVLSENGYNFFFRQWLPNWELTNATGLWLAWSAPPTTKEKMRYFFSAAPGTAGEYYRNQSFNEDGTGAIALACYEAEGAAPFRTAMAEALEKLRGLVSEVVAT